MLMLVGKRVAFLFERATERKRPEGISDAGAAEHAFQHRGVEVNNVPFRHMTEQIAINGN